MKKFIALLTVLMLIASVIQPRQVTMADIVTGLAGSVLIDTLDAAAGALDTSTAHQIRAFVLSSQTNPISKLSIMAVVDSVDTNVTFVFETSLDGTNWAVLPEYGKEDSTSRTFTSEASFLMDFDRVGTKKYFRVRKSAETGTGASVFFQWLFGQ